MIDSGGHNSEATWFVPRGYLIPRLILTVTLNVSTRDGSHNSSHYKFSAPDQNRENLAASDLGQARYHN